MAILDYSLEKLAEQSLAKPQDFAYWGSDDMFKTWGFTGIDDTNQGLLEKSNFQVITNDLMTKFPNDFRIENYGHWLVGSIDRLVCRVLFDESEINDSNITPAFKAVIKWHEELSDYPVADENHFSEMEYEANIEMIKDADYLLNYVDQSVDGWAESIYYELVNNMGVEIIPDHVSLKDDDYITAVYNTQLWNSENSELWNEWTDRNNLEPIKTRKVSKEQLKLFEDKWYE